MESYAVKKAMKFVCGTVQLLYCLITWLIRMKKLRKLDRNACDDVRKIRQRYRVKNLGTPHCTLTARL
jgi:hypothetical protein